MEKIGRRLDEPGILRIPLARQGNALTVGLAETDWKQWVKA